MPPTPTLCVMCGFDRELVPTWRRRRSATRRSWWCRTAAARRRSPGEPGDAVVVRRSASVATSRASVRRGSTMSSHAGESEQHGAAAEDEEQHLLGRPGRGDRGWDHDRHHLRGGPRIRPLSTPIRWASTRPRPSPPQTRLEARRCSAGRPVHRGRARDVDQPGSAHMAEEEREQLGGGARPWRPPATLALA